MIDRATREVKADVIHEVSATADTAAEIAESADALKGLIVACKEDGYLYFVCLGGTVTRTNLRSREPI